MRLLTFIPLALLQKIHRNQINNSKIEMFLILLNVFIILTIKKNNNLPELYHTLL